MARYFSRDTADKLAGFVDGKIQNIQKRYIAKPGGDSWSRACLARLRRDFDGATPSWMTVGSDLFAGWPDDVPLVDDSVREVAAVKAAMELYAWHQQSQPQGMAQESGAGKDRMTFGKACSGLARDPSRAKAIRRRLEAIEACPDFNGMVRGIRALIMMMRRPGGDVKPIELDYRALTRDLYQMQFPESRSAVFQRWSRDYWNSISPDTDKTKRQ
ncbi:type I-E CRISPR-associated protein Cse2/CasB [Bifidobacterium samirii]|uniref:Type I-E CRISPR-associated protein Cse2/CasB n=1 Tax=Bifidobacterium samirii TaxID=2306974 RepID=A0A430FVZ8_9BIFI|nr:type I-E CRISPR-associated protein Cse2/CasB [Bifidobacterium samirii]RSX58170.1 type I-E CRISPR-associated protein Cse2/CasB [Bifidobacterium samirii]